MRRKLEGEFEVEMVAASRKTEKGRPKRGIILAIKKGIYEEEINARKWKEREFIDKEVKRQGGRMYVGVTYMRLCRKENREMMKDIMEIARNEAVIIGGDYNAKTGEEVGCTLYKEKGRSSKDKVRNKKGEELLE